MYSLAKFRVLLTDKWRRRPATVPRCSSSPRAPAQTQRPGNTCAQLPQLGRPRQRPRGGARRGVLTSERAATPLVGRGADGGSRGVLGARPGQRRRPRSSRCVRLLRGGGCGSEAPSPGRRGLGELPGRGAARPGRMHQKLLKSAHYIELGSYQYWPVLVPRGIRLYTYEQIPVSLKDNPYITDGYRAYLPSRLCIKRYSLAASAGRAPETRWRPLLLTYPVFV